jgi:ubiquinone/menaquinone biosynthesis C-methylase UbiE
VENPKAAIASIWDMAAPGYDQSWGHGLRTPAERQAWTGWLSTVLPPSPPARVLDVGCGSGFLALLLAAAGHTVAGVDLSERMLAVARQEATRRSLNLRLIRGDAEQPPVTADRFDAVVCRHLLWTLPHPERALRAWSALLVPGGQILAIDLFWPPPPWPRRLAGQAGRLLGRITGGGHDRGYPAELAAELPLHHLPGPEPVREAFVTAGLTEVTVTPLTEIDQVERSVLPLAQRLRLNSRRELIRGRRAGAA